MRFVALLIQSGEKSPDTGGFFLYGWVLLRCWPKLCNFCNRHGRDEDAAKNLIYGTKVKRKMHLNSADIVANILIKIIDLRAFLFKIIFVT